MLVGFKTYSAVQMIAQIHSDPGEMMHHLDVMPLKQFALSDTGQFEQFWAMQGAS
tara:strand:+ start:260 stop:424 length:165 start_codon:yes stop_codon:yes gene_type:complete